MKLRIRVLLMLFVLAGAWIGIFDASAQSVSSLTLQVYVCPEGVEPSDLLGECGDRLASTYPFVVYAGPTRDTSQLVAEGTASGVGIVSVYLTDLVPGFVLIEFPAGPETRGAVGFGCSINGASLDSILGIENADHPVYEVQLPEAGDLACTLFARGFAGDVNYFGIASDDATEPVVETPVTGSSTTGATVSTLPATGAGRPGSGLPFELAAVIALLVSAGVVVLRRLVVVP